MAQRCSLQKVPSAAEHARDFLRRSLCAARRAEFFLYEKMGRRAIVFEESISVVQNYAGTLDFCRESWYSYSNLISHEMI